MYFSDTFTKRYVFVFITYVCVFLVHMLLILQQMHQDPFVLGTVIKPSLIHFHWDSRYSRIAPQPRGKIVYNVYFHYSLNFIIKFLYLYLFTVRFGAICNISINIEFCV